MLGDFKVIVDGDPNTMKLLMDAMPSIMTFVSTTYNFDEECSILKGPYWEFMFIGFSIVRFTSNLSSIYAIEKHSRTSSQL